MTDDERLARLDDLEAVLGYRFRDRELLVQALRHSSWCHERPEPRPADYERLEFLGDAVLGLTVGQRLMQRFPQGRPASLSVTRAQVVNEAGLSSVAASLELGRWLLLGRGEDLSGGRAKPKILEDMFEALVGAVYLDGGFEAAQALVSRLLTDRINAAELRNFRDFKSLFQETAQARLKVTPTYRVIETSGPDHDRQFVVAVMVGDEEWGRAVGKSRKEAEVNAAAEAHFRLAASAGRPRR